MYVCFRDLFKIGIGPSSSHTVGPMRAAARFVSELTPHQLDRVSAVRIELYSSLALTGLGHRTDAAILLGLEGATPDQIDPRAISSRLEAIRAQSALLLGGIRRIRFVDSEHLIFRGADSLPFHPNGMRFTAVSGTGDVLDSRVFYSVGGGFIHADGEEAGADLGCDRVAVPHAFGSAAELLDVAHRAGLTISGVVRANEDVLVPGEGVSIAVDAVWTAMQECVSRGLATSGTLPGPLNVVRRAPRLAARLMAGPASDSLSALDWVATWAMAVNEENAAGGRVVTAPTNGAAGVIPAVAHHYMNQTPAPTTAGLEDFFLTAAAIGGLCKMNASISGAEVGCQGEVGVACAMAAGGLVAALGGTALQVEQAAEIGIEHHLGMTCDPVAGLVQIPCIERNALGAVKALAAARMALGGDGTHRVSLDQAIETMRTTGRDMQARYKETSLGGLALTLIEC